MVILLYIIIGLWLAKGLFEVVRALALIAYALCCGLLGLTLQSVASVMDFLVWLWRLARWTK